MLITPSAVSNGESMVIPKAVPQGDKWDTGTHFIPSSSNRRCHAFVSKESAQEGLYYIHDTCIVSQSVSCIYLCTLWGCNAKKVLHNVSIFNLILGTACTAHWQVAWLQPVLNDLYGNFTLLCQTGSLTWISEKIQRLLSMWETYCICQKENIMLELFWLHVSKSFNNL